MIATVYTGEEEVEIITKEKLYDTLLIL